MAAYCNGAMSYSNTGGCYGAGKHGHSGRTMSYSNTTDVVKCDGGSEQGQGQGYYKREDRQHKSRERVGEVSALAAGAFALYAYQEHREQQKQAGYGGGGAPKQHRGPALDE